MSRNKNLTYDERCIIQKGIHECASKREIGKTIGKDFYHLVFLHPYRG